MTSLTGQSGDSLQSDVKTPNKEKKQPPEIAQNEQTEPKVKNETPVVRSSSEPIKSQPKNETNSGNNKVDSGIKVGNQGKSQSMIEHRSTGNNSAESVTLENKLQLEGISTETVDNLESVGVDNSNSDSVGDSKTNFDNSTHKAVHRTKPGNAEKVKLGQLPRVISIVKDENLDRESSTDEPDAGTSQTSESAHTPTIASDADITNYVVDKLVAESNRIQETVEVQKNSELLLKDGSDKADDEMEKVKETAEAQKNAKLSLKDRRDKAGIDEGEKAKSDEIDDFTVKAHKELQRLDTLLDMAEEEGGIEINEEVVKEEKIGEEAVEKMETDSTKGGKISEIPEKLSEKQVIEINEKQEVGENEAPKVEIDPAKDGKGSQNVALLDTDLPEAIPRERRLSRGNAVKIHDVNELPVEVKEIRRKSQEISIVDICQTVPKTSTKVEQTEFTLASPGKESNDIQTNLSEHAEIKVIDSSKSVSGSGKSGESVHGKSIGSIAGGGECGMVEKSSQRKVGEICALLVLVIACGV